LRKRNCREPGPFISAVGLNTTDVIKGNHADKEEKSWNLDSLDYQETNNPVMSELATAEFYSPGSDKGKNRHKECEAG
jgi:hypothetical protein